MKILHLTLKKKWFDMILSGEKKEEYREIKRHWNRIFYECGTGKPAQWGQCVEIDWKPEFKCKYTCPCHKCDVSELKKFDFIEFRNGYSKDAPTMLVESKGIMTGIGNSDWGAPAQPVFVIRLGEVVETKNIK